VKDPRDVVLSEFVNYYNADELPLVLAGDVDEQADDSGRRFVHVLGAGAWRATSALQRVVDGEDESLLEDLDRRTMYAWSGTQEDKELLRRIVRGISAAVERELARLGNSDEG
jgi:hypothetical protein